MGKPLKYATVLILACLFFFLCLLNRETFLTDRERFALFTSYLERAFDPQEKQLRMAEWKKEAPAGKPTGRVIATLTFVDEKYYLNAFSKTYRLLLIRNTGIDDNDWIDAGLLLTVDYGVFKDTEVIYWLNGVTKNDSYWKGLYSFYDHPVHSVRKKILGEEIF